MNKLTTTLFLVLFLLFPSAISAQQSAEMASPDGKVNVKFFLRDSIPFYSIDFQNQHVILPSRLGIALQNFPSFDKGFTIAETSTSSFDETWQPVWGEESSIRNHYNELAVTLLQPSTGRNMTIRFRVYDEGVGFRYELARHALCDNPIVSDELTEFALSGDHTAYWIPGDYDTDEYEYTISRLSDVRRLYSNARTANACQTMFSPTGLQTSLLMKTDSGLFINIHEAALVDYSEMHLNLDDKNFVLHAWLTPDAKGRKAFLRCPASTPWRTVMVVDDARKMLASRLILNLNEPCKIEDTSWIHPIKYMGVWWEMMSGKSTWNYADYQAIRIGETDYESLKPTGRHAANNDNVKKYIDFASRHGFSELLVEGWNQGWEDNWQKDFNYSFTLSYPDFNVQELQAYARQKGMRLMMHHETSASVANYERQLEEAYRFASENGYDAIKSGYVGYIFPNGGYHCDQWMVNHYNYCVRLAAKYHLMVNGHEAVRPTGLCRTWPNMIGNESARGTEFQASEGILPQHVTILPFTRLQGGPMDYTPGLFQMDISKVNPQNHAHAICTLCNQLALYVTLYSPLQMASDVPESYEKHLDAFQFIKDVAVDWQKSVYLEAEPGDYLTIARKEKGGERWFVGGVAGRKAHTADFKLSFLDKGKRYHATIYRDADNASWRDNPEAYVIENKVVTSRSRLRLHAVEAGGWAISLTPIN